MFLQSVQNYFLIGAFVETQNTRGFVVLCICTILNCFCVVCVLYIFVQFCTYENLGYNGVNSVILDCYPVTCANEVLEAPDHSTLTARLTDGSREFTCDTGFSVKRGSLDNKITATCDSDNHNEGMVEWWCLELGGDFSIFDDYDFDYRKQSETVWHNGNLNIPG